MAPHGSAVLAYSCVPSIEISIVLAPPTAVLKTMTLLPTGEQLCRCCLLAYTPKHAANLEFKCQARTVLLRTLHQSIMVSASEIQLSQRN